MNTHYIRARTVNKPILDSYDCIGMSPPWQSTLISSAGMNCTSKGVNA